MPPFLSFHRHWQGRSQAALLLSVVLSLGVSGVALAQNAVKPPAPSKKAAKNKPRLVKVEGMTDGTYNPQSVRSVSRLIAAYKAEEKRQEQEKEEREEKEARPQTARNDKKITERAALRKKSGIGSPAFEKDERLDIMEAMLHYLKPRAFPNDKLDTDAFTRSLAHRDQMPPARLSGGGRSALATGPSLTAAPTWKFLGPKNASPPWPYGAGPKDVFLSGRVNAIAFDPTTKDAAYLVSPSGGVWKTTDRGTNWTPLGDKFVSMKCSSVAVGPDGTVFVGMGDYSYTAAYGFSYFSKGIMRSKDGGATWQNVGSDVMSGMAISAITVDPDDPKIVMAATGRGTNGKSYLFRSADGGSTFERVALRGSTGLGDWSDLQYSRVLNAKGQRYYYAACSAPQKSAIGQIWRSANKGETWTRLSVPLMTPYYLPYYNLMVAPSATDANTVYVLEGDTSFADGNIWKGTTDGASDIYLWSNISEGYDTNFYFRQAFYDMHLTVGKAVGTDPKDVKDMVYAGTLGLGGSLGGEENWTDISRTYDVDYAFDPAIGFFWSAVHDTFHTDQQAGAFDPFTDNTAMVTSDGGVFELKFDPAKTGNDAYTVTSKNGTLGVTEFYYGDFHPNDSAIMLGGAQDNSTPNSSGDLNNWTNVGVGDGGGAAILQTGPNAYSQFSSSTGYGIIFRTSDNWVTRWFNGFIWDQLLDGSPGEFITPDFGFDARAFVGPVVADSGSGAVYLGTNYVWRWDEIRHRWDGRTGNWQLSPQSTVAAIAIAPSDSNRLYAGTGDGLLWMSKNRGDTWLKMANSDLPLRAITAIDVHPKNPNDIIVTFSGTGSRHVYRNANTSNLPYKFVNISGFDANGLPDIPTNAVARDPAAPDTAFFVGTDIGAFYTSDGGKNWGNASVPLGLPNVQISTMKVTTYKDPISLNDVNYLNAATYGRGMWRLAISSVSVPVEDPVKLSIAFLAPVRQGRRIAVPMKIINNGEATASAIRISDIKVTIGATTVDGAPVPLNVGAIPGKKNNRAAYLVKNITFLDNVGPAGSVVTVTIKGNYSQAGPHPFTLSGTFIMP